MSEEPENLTLRLLQEMRTEMRELRVEVKDRFDGLDERIDGLETRIDGNTVLLNMVAGLLHNHEQRIDTLEAHKR